jgi:murein hydrolase activator
MPLLSACRLFTIRVNNVAWLTVPDILLRPGLGRGCLSLKTICLVSIVVCWYLLFFVAGAGGFQDESVGIVTADFLNLRSGPNLDNPPIKTLRSGAKLIIHEDLDGWLKVSAGDQAGYVRYREQYIKIIGNVQKEDQTPGGPQTDVERIKKEAEEIKRKIEKSKQDVVTFARKETDTINRLNDIDLTLNEAVKRVSVLKSEFDALDRKIAATASDISEAQERIYETELYASKRLVSLYKLSQIGRIHLLASADSIYDLFQRKAALEKILARDEQIWETLKRDNGCLKSLLKELNEQRDQKHEIEISIEKQIQVKSKERAKRKKLLDDIRNKKSLEISVIGALKQAALDLDHTIRSLSIQKPTPKTVSPPANAVKQKDAGKDEFPLKPFGELKGLLNMPVKGKIITHFGRFTDTRFHVVSFRSGIDIQTDRGEPIHAVSGGRVQYASWFKGYGNMIIIDHGNSYYTVYAHAEELFKSKGDIVEVGEVIATVGDSGSITGTALHFELRYHGKPLDPLKWIKKG